MNSSAPKRDRISQNIIPFDNTVSTPFGKEMAKLDHILRLTEEAAVLGSILQDNSLFVQVSNQLQPGDFYNLLHGFIWMAFDRISARKVGIDLMTIADVLDGEDKCPLKGEGLLNYLSSLYAAPADRNNIEHYAQRVREAALKVRMLKSLDAMRDLVYEERDIDALVDGSNKLLFTATEQYRVEETSASAIVSKLWDEIETLRNGGKSPTIATGFDKFDRLTAGATPGEVMIIAGSEKQGKTTLLLSWIRNMCMAGQHVLLFTLEMSKSEIMRLLIAMEGGIYRDNLKTGQLSTDEWGRFVEAAGRVNAWPLDIEDQYKSLTPTQARRQIRFHQAQHPVDVVGIDGLWLMDGDDEKMNANDRTRTVHNITRDLTEQAKLFSVPILITHQYVNRMAQGNADKPPSLYDLSESSSARRNPQLIVGLHRAKEMIGGIEVMQSKLYILGDRNGRSTGEIIDLEYDKTYSLYKESGSCKTHPF